MLELFAARAVREMFSSKKTDELLLQIFSFPLWLSSMSAMRRAKARLITFISPPYNLVASDLIGSLSVCNPFALDFIQ